MEEPSGPSRPIPAAARAGLILLGVAVIFGVVLLVEVNSADRVPRAGAELLPAPAPLLPDRVAGYTITPEPELAGALDRDYRRRSVSVLGIDAASIPLRNAAASVVAASLDSTARPESAEFRAGVLSGAAAGFGIDLSASPVRPARRMGVDVYRADAPDGRLYVWFFRDAFVQLYVPAALATDAEEIQRVLLAAQVSAVSSQSALASPAQ